MRRAVAVATAVLFGLSGYGVYATTLSVSGSAGTAVQAGSDLDVTMREGCQATSVEVVENYLAGDLDPVTGFPDPARTGFTVSGVQAGCAGKYLTLAAKLDGAYQSVGTWQVNSTSHEFTSSLTGTTTAYSIRITTAAP